jgi:hypothetical protein
VARVRGGGATRKRDEVAGGPRRAAAAPFGRSRFAPHSRADFLGSRRSLALAPAGEGARPGSWRGFEVKARGGGATRWRQDPVREPATWRHVAAERPGEHATWSHVAAGGRGNRPQSRTYREAAGSGPGHRQAQRGTAPARETRPPPRARRGPPARPRRTPRRPACSRARRARERDPAVARRRVAQQAMPRQRFEDGPQPEPSASASPASPVCSISATASSSRVSTAPGRTSAAAAASSSICAAVANSRCHAPLSQLRAAAGNARCAGACVAARTWRVPRWAQVRRTSRRASSGSRSAVASSVRPAPPHRAVRGGDAGSRRGARRRPARRSACRRPAPHDRLVPGTSRGLGGCGAPDRHLTPHRRSGRLGCGCAGPGTVPISARAKTARPPPAAAHGAAVAANWASYSAR